MNCKKLRLIDINFCDQISESQVFFVAYCQVYNFIVKFFNMHTILGFNMETTLSIGCYKKMLCCRK